MSGAPKVRSLNVLEESETRPVLGPAGNKTRSPSITQKPASKPLRKVERVESAVEDEKKKDISPVLDSPTLVSSLSAPSSVLRRQELLLRSNLSLNASCSSDVSTDSFCSRASMGRIGRVSYGSRRRQGVPRPENIASKLEKIVPDGEGKDTPDFLQGKRRCAWVTPNTDPCYAAFHDEEWGVPVHDDKYGIPSFFSFSSVFKQNEGSEHLFVNKQKILGWFLYRKLFELLVLSGALAELTWPAILGKRHIFRRFSWILTL